MWFFHVTPWKNLTSIGRHGLLCGKRLRELNIGRAHHGLGVRSTADSDAMRDNPGTGKEQEVGESIRCEQGSCLYLTPGVYRGDVAGCRHGPLFVVSSGHSPRE